MPIVQWPIPNSGSAGSMLTEVNLKPIAIRGLCNRGEIPTKHLPDGVDKDGERSKDVRGNEDARRSEDA